MSVVSDRDVTVRDAATGVVDPPHSAEVRAGGWFDALARHRFATLATRRRNGTMVPTTMWFAVAGDVVYVNTDRRSAKVKRIRNNPLVTLCPCTMRGRPKGPEVEGVASIVPRAEQARADAAIAARYGWQRRLFEALHRERMTHSELIEIRPPARAAQH
jgi:PPOX class probable F420-dependent enzyme